MTEMTAPDGGQQLVFLICSERSGSNLISAILNNHSEIGATPPYHLCRDVGLGWHAVRDAGIDSDAWRATRELIVNRFRTLRDADAAAAIDEWLGALRELDFGVIARHVLSTASGLADSRLVFVKENNIHRMLFFILQQFPDAKFVFQVRDPRDYLLSAAERKEGRWRIKFGSRLHALEIWRDDQLGGLTAWAHLGPERVFFQRYEDLITRPAEVLTALCAFLGVEFEEAMLDFHTSDYVAGLAKPGGPRANLANPLMSDNHAKYLTGLTTRDIRMVEVHVGDLMARFGYQCDLPTTTRRRRTSVARASVLEPFERLVNAEVEPFYSDGHISAIARHGGPLTAGYERG